MASVALSAERERRTENVFHMLLTSCLLQFSRIQPKSFYEYLTILRFEIHCKQNLIENYSTGTRNFYA